MPQMAIIQPATPKGPPQTRTADTNGEKEQNTFSPHLDKAVANNKKQQPVDQEKNATHSFTQADKKVSIDSTAQPMSETDSEAFQDGIAIADAVMPDDVAVAADTAVAMDTVKLAVESDDLPGQLLVPAADTNQPKPIAVRTAFSQLQQIEPTVQTHRNTPDITPGEPSAKVIPTEFSSAVTKPTIEIALKPTVANTQTALLDQLQKIIDQADETGIVSIKKVVDPPFVNSIRGNIHGLLSSAPVENPAQGILSGNSPASDIPAASLLFTDTQGAEKSVPQANRQSTGIRYDTQQQLLNSRIVTKDFQDGKQNFQDHQPGDELPQQAQQTVSVGTQSGLSTTLLNGSEQTNTFSQAVTSIQPTTAQQTAETAKPILLSPGTMILEEEIIQQMSHKLQISSRNMDSHINLKLHPAELGSLKIDLTVKEGSIRANVVAQSQHTTEILEKNMAKLKTILENQGFTVDEISITSESESVSDFNLFDRQLFSHEDYTPKAAKKSRDDEAVFTLADNIFPAPTSTGVNVKI